METELDRSNDLRRSFGLFMANIGIGLQGQLEGVHSIFRPEKPVLRLQENS